MSNSGLLTEDEIRTYIQDSFGLLIDREALIKPTKETVTKIYTYFLDGTGFVWMIPQDPSKFWKESNRLHLMVRAIHTLTSCYNMSFTFQISDIVAPTRKRTVAFLNVLIYIRAQVEEKQQKLEDLNERRDIRIEEIEKSSRQVALQRLELEDLAYKIASAPSKEDLIDTIKSLREKFKFLEKEGERLEVEGKTIKSSIQKCTERLEGELILADEAQTREISELENKSQLLEEGNNFKKRIEAVEQALLALEDQDTKLNLQLKFKEQESNLDIETDIQSRKDIEQEMRDWFGSRRRELEEHKNRNLKIIEEKSAKEKSHKEYEGRIERSLRICEQNYQESKKRTQEAELSMKEYQFKIDLFLGKKPKEMELAADRTYIKQPAM